MSSKLSIDILKTISDMDISISKNLIIQKLENRFNWPKLKFDRYYPLEIILDGGSKKNKSLYLEDGFIDQDLAISMYQEGYTIIIVDAGLVFDELKPMQDLLNSTLNTHVFINCYAGNGIKSISWNEQKSRNDIIVKNIQGESHWRVDQFNGILKDQKVLSIPSDVQFQEYSIISDRICLVCQIK